MLNFFLIVGVISFVVSGIFIGAFTTGQQQRSNFHSETAEHYHFRTKIRLISGFIAFISFAILAFLYFL
ncbi:DUF5316 family protein [Sporosarcina soli]|uniref:DUF5316 family protein n=1 Tax=Sporosarcina soli TaxID=334736 RepID=A0ABW0TH92_9BACL